MRRQNFKNEKHYKYLVLNSLAYLNAFDLDDLYLALVVDAYHPSNPLIQTH